jgi:pyruvate, orthophosphate dikinase
MPGMMDTVLNLGLNDATVEALAKQAEDRRFAYDSYRRFITMYSDVVLGVGHHVFEEILDEHKDRNGYMLDTDLEADDWAELVTRYKDRVVEELGKPFPQDPHEQLWGAIGAVFGSWMNQRAITYRRLHNIPESWGTAVNVQAMVFGNMGDTSATGVAFTRNPSTGEKRLYGEFLINAQGEDVVAGIRTPQEITAARRAPTGRRWKPRCRWRSRSSSAFAPCSSATTATCRTSNSRWSRASSGCCRRARASAPPRRR